MLRLFTQFERNVSEIRFYNDKSMGVAKDNMIEIDPEMVLHSQAGQKTGPANPYEKIREEHRQERSSRLETKV